MYRLDLGLNLPQSKIMMKIIQVVCLISYFVFFAEYSAVAGTYVFSETRKDTPQEFYEFLDACTAAERVRMLQALGALLPLSEERILMYKLEKLRSFNSCWYDDPKRIVVNDMFFDSSLSTNDVSPDIILDAVRVGIIDSSAISAKAVRDALVGKAYNEIIYPFKKNKDVDYHGIVRWAAGKTGLSIEKVDNATTFQLEGEIAKSVHAKFGEETPRTTHRVPDYMKYLVIISSCPFVSSPYPLYTLSFLMALDVLANSVMEYITADYDAVSLFITNVYEIKARKWANKQ